MINSPAILRSTFDTPCPNQNNHHESPAKRGVEKEESFHFLVLRYRGVQCNVNVLSFI